MSFFLVIVIELAGVPPDLPTSHFLVGSQMTTFSRLPSSLFRRGPVRRPPVSLNHFYPEKECLNAERAVVCVFHQTFSSTSGRASWPPPSLN